MVNGLQIPSSSDDSTVIVEHQAANRFYELMIDDTPAGLLVYEGSPDRRVFTHAFMYDGFRGRGLVRPLIQGALDDIRRSGATVTNYCPVVGHFFEVHPEYAELLDPHTPGEWSSSVVEGEDS
jgi:predicted GNAT family acetyltransferase